MSKLKVGLNRTYIYKFHNHHFYNNTIIYNQCFLRVVSLVCGK